jgi:sugar phosphate isomerase/epimerase
VTEERKSTVGYLVECLDLALDLGCRTIVVNGGWSVQPYGRDEAWRWAAEGLAVVAHEAEHRDVAVALENINSQRADVVVTSRDVTAMVNEVGSLALRPMIDFYHLHLEGKDPLEAIDRFGDGLAYIHFLDARLADRARLAPGWGEMPLPAILAALRQVGYNDWLGYEIWGDDHLTLGRRAVSFFAEQQQQLS